MTPFEWRTLQMDTWKEGRSFEVIINLATRKKKSQVKQKQ